MTFTKDELKDIENRARELSEIPYIIGSWKAAFKKLEEAAFDLHEMIKKTGLPMVPSKVNITNPPTKIYRKNK